MDLSILAQCFTINRYGALTLFLHSIYLEVDFVSFAPCCKMPSKAAQRNMDGRLEECLQSS